MAKQLWNSRAQQDRRTKEEILLEQILDLTDGQLPEVVASLSLRELKKYTKNSKAAHGMSTTFTPSIHTINRQRLSANRLQGLRQFGGAGLLGF